MTVPFHLGPLFPWPGRGTLTKYRNGEIPKHLLVQRPSAGKSNCLMMPGTAAKHDKLVALAKGELGWTPVVSGPDDAYRVIEVQRYYYNTMPAGMAAYPGTSSHGGTYEGADCGAVDYGNWGQVGVDRFFDLARRAGFEPGYFMGQHGRPYEPWHVFDRTPWDVPAEPEQSEEDEMKNSCVYYQKDNAWIYLVFNTGSGWYHEYSNGPGEGTMPGEYNNPLAATLGTGSFAKVTASHAGAIKSSLDLVRNSK